MQHAAGETAELVLAVQNLDGVASADALALQVVQLVGSNKVVTAVGVAPTGPEIICFWLAQVTCFRFLMLLLLS